VTLKEYERQRGNKQRDAEFQGMLFTFIWRGSLVVVALLIILH
jgi:hypothetical protein